MNQGTFVGRVGADCEVRYTQQGKPVADFSVAIDQGKNSNGDKRDALWIKAVLWEKKAEALAQYITKGKMVAVSGPVSTEAWVDKQSGNARSKIVVTVREFTFCGGSKNEDGGQQPNTPASPPVDPQNSGPITDDDIPF